MIIILSLVGTWLLWHRARTAGVTLLRLDPDRPPGDPVFDGLGSTIGPLVVTVVLASAAELSTLTRFPFAYTLVDLPLILLVTLPIGGFVWAYGVVLVSLDRLGQRALELEPFPGDRTLGLKPIGGLVLVGFTVTSLGVVTYLLALGQYLVDFLIGAGLFVVIVVLLVLSMWRLHLQMAKARNDYIEKARALYVAAYRPLRDDPSMEVLEQQSRKISAAESIEKRAKSIHEWPVDDRTVARFAVVATGVATGLILRAVLAATGL